MPSGRTRSLLELGHASAPGRSIKGEVEFPQRRQVTTDTISERVALNRGTTGGTCHLRESDVSEAHFEGAYDQREPFLGYEVDIESLREQSASCNPEIDPERCDILGALVDHGEVRRTSRWSAEGGYAPSDAGAG